MSLAPEVWDLIFPPKCVFCGALLGRPRDMDVCPGCQRDLPWLAGSAAEQKFEFLELCVSPLRYQGQVRQAVHRYKFQGRRFCADTFGILMAQCVRDHFDAPFDVISWVPLSRRRLRERGYDQARLLAETAARRLSLPLDSLLDKLRDNPAQSGLEGAAERRANVLGAYALSRRAAVAGKRILLCDDVATTGATLSECARVLRTAGADTVCAVTLARAH